MLAIAVVASARMGALGRVGCVVAMASSVFCCCCCSWSGGGDAGGEGGRGGGLSCATADSIGGASFRVSSADLREEVLVARFDVDFALVVDDFLTVDDLAEPLIAMVSVDLCAGACCVNYSMSRNVDRMIRRTYGSVSTCVQFRYLRSAR